MAIEKGAIFSSFEEFQFILKKHEDEYGVLYITSGSKKLRTELQFFEKLQYQNIKFACKQGRRTMQSASQGIRPNQKTLKTGCPAVIRLNLVEDGDTYKLKVTTCHLVHENHPTGQEFSQLYPENRRPTMSSELTTLLSLKSVSVQDIKNIVRQNEGKIILSHDVWNLKNKLCGQMKDELLIQCVQKYSLLYDQSDPKYSNRDSTQKAWAEVAANLNETVDVVKKRWTYLRDDFQKQQRFLESVKSEEWSTKKKKWPLYDSLTFLLPYMEFGNITTASDGVSETHQSLGSSDDVSEESFSVTFDNQLADSVKREQDLYQQPSRKRTINELDHQFFDAPKGQHYVEDDHEHFLKSLLPVMRTLDSLAAMEFRHEVQGLLIKYIKRAHVQDMPSQSDGNSP